MKKATQTLSPGETPRKFMVELHDEHNTVIFTDRPDEFTKKHRKATVKEVGSYPTKAE